LKQIKAKSIEVVINEPVLTEQDKNKYFHSKVTKNLCNPKHISFVILANKML